MAKKQKVGGSFKDLSLDFALDKFFLTLSFHL